MRYVNGYALAPVTLSSKLCICGVRRHTHMNSVACSCSGCPVFCQATYNPSDSHLYMVSAVVGWLIFEVCYRVRLYGEDNSTSSGLTGMMI